MPGASNQMIWSFVYPRGYLFKSELLPFIYPHLGPPPLVFCDSALAALIFLPSVENVKDCDRGIFAKRFEFDNSGSLTFIHKLLRCHERFFCLN